MNFNFLSDIHRIGRMLSCSVCTYDLTSRYVEEWQHPTLKVALCTECKDRWEASQAAEPESDERTSDDVCSWCAYGGELSCCDSCSRAVCADCFERETSILTL